MAQEDDEAGREAKDDPEATTQEANTSVFLFEDEAS